MPYTSLSELPDYIKEMPLKAQAQWMSVFNSVWQRYANTAIDEKSLEQICFTRANGVIKRAYHKEGGRWVETKASTDITRVDAFKNLSPKFDSRVYKVSFLTDVMRVSDGTYHQINIDKFAKYAENYPRGILCFEHDEALKTGEINKIEVDNKTAYAYIQHYKTASHIADYIDEQLMGNVPPDMILGISPSVIYGEESGEADEILCLKHIAETFIPANAPEEGIEIIEKFSSSMTPETVDSKFDELVTGIAIKANPPTKKDDSMVESAVEENNEVEAMDDKTKKDFEAKIKELTEAKIKTEADFTALKGEFEAKMKSMDDLRLKAESELALKNEELLKVKAAMDKLITETRQKEAREFAAGLNVKPDSKEKWIELFMKNPEEARSLARDIISPVPIEPPKSVGTDNMIACDPMANMPKEYIASIERVKTRKVKY